MALVIRGGFPIVYHILFSDQTIKIQKQRIYELSFRCDLNTDSSKSDAQLCNCKGVNS